MSIRLLAAVACSFLMVGESFAQYQPQYQPYYSNQQPAMMGQGRMSQPGYPAMQNASMRMRQDQAVQAAVPGQPMMEAPVYQAPTQAAAAPPLVPSMVAPNCGANYVDPNCGCNASCSGNPVGGNYFDSGCNDCFDSCCSDRYVKLFGGWNWLQDMTPDPQTAPNNRGRLGFNDGWAAGAAIGRCITQRARGELEFTYRNNTGDVIPVAPPALVVPTSGLINCYSLMGNLVYDLQGLQLAGFKPYMGGGLGVAHVDGEFAGGAIDFDDTVFAYQAFAGVGRQLSAQTKLLAEYRYFATSEVEIDPPFADNYQANNLFFGLQFNR